ncbi:MAG: putative Translational machinery protein [Labilithrix sp.]|nr:putative Translational machinery protein [Labilithrix sp.]
MSKHVVVWLDHHEARIFHLSPDSVEEATLTAPTHHHLKHSDAKGHPDDAKKFFHEIARLISDSEEILVVGPSTAKLGLIRHLHQHDAKLEPRVVGVETVDHPSPGELVKYAKQYFVAADRMR